MKDGSWENREYYATLHTDSIVVIRIRHYRLKYTHTTHIHMNGQSANKTSYTSYHPDQCTIIHLHVVCSQMYIRYLPVTTSYGSLPKQWVWFSRSSFIRDVQLSFHLQFLEHPAAADSVLYTNKGVWVRGYA